MTRKDYTGCDGNRYRTDSVNLHVWTPGGAKFQIPLVDLQNLDKLQRFESEIAMNDTRNEELKKSIAQLYKD